MSFRIEYRRDRESWDNDLVQLEHVAMEAADRIAVEYELWGRAEATYRIAKNVAYTKARMGGKSQGDALIYAQAESAEEQAALMAAEGIAKSSLEAARTARTRVSSAQSRLGAWKEEMSLAKTGTIA